MTSSDQHRRISDLFGRAIALPLEERPAFLDGACSGETEIRSRVEAMLAKDAAENAFLPRNDVHARLPELVSSVYEGPVPERIGAYRVLGIIGAGGMAVVYRADQESPRRRVALKVIRPGFLSEELRRRFELEISVLGRLQHPGIAQIHDAGMADTGSGPQPYFAMELVEGRPLNRYVNEEKLPLEERLRLFVRICEAVHHAHQKGVIHRDLKPGNIQVDGAGQPKILDFGIARATDVDVQRTTVRTDVGQLIGTLPYMSPEQASGDPRDLDIRSDVYSLGIILYELLSNSLPYALGSEQIIEAVRIIQEQSPTPLSSFNRVLRGDLETIVGKTLEKDKERRYQSCAELALDIERHLRWEPIRARPPSILYQLRKFTLRNRVLVAAVSAVFVALSAGLWTATYGLKEANTALDNFAIAANIKKLDDLEQRAVDLWPMLPHRTTEMERWLAEARILVKQQGVLDQVLQRLEAGSQEVHDPRSLEEILTTDEREQYERLLLTRELLMAAERTAGSQPEPLEWVLSKIGTVEESARRPLRRFQEESDGWLYEHVVPFKERLAAFAAPVTGTIADVEQRLYQARSIASKTTGSYQGQWLEATEAIRKDVRFGDWTLSPQIGLIPLGADPESGFWEFWHLQSGERPERCEETGRWHVRRETGIVLVLLPGGTFRMEAEHFDEQITNGDAPEAAGPWSLRIDPFFLSKYEMTFGQWHRVTGENPSDFDPDVAVAADGWIHPVERVSWSHSRATLRRIHLVLPTEAQWEYAARAGTRTPWWCGAEPTSIHDERAGNVWDEGSAKARPRLDYGVPEPWSDGHVTHSPVGSFEPNRFGLHDVVGNLWEWCRDRHMPYQGAFVWRSKDGEILAAEEPEDDHRMYRGGSFINTARSAAASFRNHNTPDFRNHYVGLRPACVVDP